MSLLTVFDVLVVVLTWLEWQKQLRLRQANDPLATKQP